MGERIRSPLQQTNTQKLAKNIAMLSRGPLQRPFEKPKPKNVVFTKHVKTDNAEPPQNKKKTVKVCVRIRPLSKAEIALNNQLAWSWERNTITQEGKFLYTSYTDTSEDTATRCLEYVYDHLFYPEHSTEKIYTEVTQDIVVSAMEGYHGTIFAYGQTSTGKTYTMQGTSSCPGIIPLAVDTVFDYIENVQNKEFLLRVSYLEIYNEQVVDLLSPSSTTGIQILNSQSGKVVIRGLKEEVVVSPDQVYSLITSGEAYRHTAETSFNRESSRSHTIFRLVIESRSLDRNVACTTPNSLQKPVLVSVLNLVDLAGSEGGRLSNTSGKERREGHFINKSLHTLSHVIFKLSELADIETAVDRNEVPKKSASSIHIPYRDSKLTRLLQSSLSGNAQVAVVCTISPAFRSLDETHNTLKFASRAKRVRNRATVNEVGDDKALLKQYREEIMRLKGQLDSNQLSSLSSQSSESTLGQYDVTRALTEASEEGSTEDGDADEKNQKNSQEEEVADIINAIAHLERLILSGGARQSTLLSVASRNINFAAQAQKGSPKFFAVAKHQRLSLSKARSDSLAAIRDSPSQTPSDSPLGSPKAEAEKAQLFPGVTAPVFEDYIPSTPTHVAVNEQDFPLPPPPLEDANILHDLEAIKGMLHRVLQKKGVPTSVVISAAAASPAISPLLGDSSESFRQISSPVPLQNSLFLENELQKKEQMVQEMIGLLADVERRQSALEAENKTLKQKVLALTNVIKAREEELLTLKGISPAEETF